MMDKNYRFLESLTFGPVQYGVQLGKDGGFFLENRIPNVREHAEFIASAPAVIKQKDTLIAELVEALESAQKTLAMMVNEDAIECTSIATAYANCRQSELKCRKALAKAGGVS